MVLLGLGSNMGDRAANLKRAVRLLEANGVCVERASSLYETEPFGFKEQAAFLNAALCVRTVETPLELLRVCQRIETALGRVRTVRWGPRPLDIDLLTFNGKTLDLPELTLPHPYLAERRFVLIPLAEIVDAPLVGGRTPQELLRVCGDRGGVELYETAESWLS